MRRAPPVPLVAALVLGAASALSGCTGRPLAPGGARIGVEVTPRIRGGPVSGDLQTGKGGAPGSSSLGRPTLEEIGVNEAVEPGLEVVVRWKRHEVVLDGAALLLDGDSTLSEPLVSQGDLYPAGTAVESDTSIVFARLGYRYRATLCLGEEAIDILPGAGVSWFQYDYRLDGSNGEDADRNYSHWAPGLALGLSWRPRGRGPVRFTADFSQTLPFLLPDDNQTDIFEAAARVHYDLTRNWSLHLETGYRHFEFEDDQPLPNHPQVDFGPWIGVGLSARF